jgi:hypothetical protein
MGTEEAPQINTQGEGWGALLLAESVFFGSMRGRSHHHKAARAGASALHFRMQLVCEPPAAQ